MSVAGSQSGAKPPWNPDHRLEVSVGEVAAAFRAGEMFRLIDCREEDEYALCRIKGAQLCPLTELCTSGWESLVGQSEVVLVYCHHGMRSLRATALLRAKGCSNVFSLTGGIDLWAREVDPEIARY